MSTANIDAIVTASWTELPVGALRAFSLTNKSDLAILRQVKSSAPSADDYAGDVVRPFQADTLSLSAGDKLYVRLDPLPPHLVGRGASLTGLVSITEAETGDGGSGPGRAILPVTANVSIARARALWVGATGSPTIDITDRAGNAVDGFPVDGYMIPVEVALVRNLNGLSVFAIF